MSTVYFATTNSDKLLLAKTVCSQVGIRVVQEKVDIDEIQGEDPKIIVEDKAKRSYEQIKKPVVVSDDSWDIPVFKGFPGPYMKSINHWFSAQDFLRLMKGIEDRPVILHQYISFYDGKSASTFSCDIHGIIISEPRGKNDKSPNTTVTVLDHDNGKTIAEVFEQGIDAVVARYNTRHDAWHKFVEWYKSTQL